MRKIIFGLLGSVFLCLLFSSCVTFLVASTIKKQSVSNDIKTEITGKGYPLVITYLDTYSPNSAGGIDVELVFINLSEQKLKYVFFDLIPYNAVDDVVADTITKKAKATLKVTGPVKSNEKQPAVRTYDNVWWNSEIRKAKVTGIRVTFMDDTSISYDETQSQEMCKSFYKK